MDLTCVRCKKPELLSDCKGNVMEARPDRNSKKQTLARLCSTCTQVLLGTKQPNIPWDGEEIKSEKMRLRRR